MRDVLFFGAMIIFSVFVQASDDERIIKKEKYTKNGVDYVHVWYEDGSEGAYACLDDFIAIGPNLDVPDKNSNVEYDKGAPLWCQVTDGFNFGGYCQNPSCKAYTRYVFMPVGKVEYLIQNSKYCHPAKCPMCKKDAEIRDWGFSHCSFQIEWRNKVGRGIRDWRRADRYYVRFSMDELGKAEYLWVKVLYKGPKDVLPSPNE